VSGEPRAFFALDQGAATTSAALVGRVAGRWRLLGALGFPRGVDVDAILDALVARLRAAEPELGDELDLGGPARDWPRLTARSSPPAGLAVLAAAERSLEPLVAAGERTGWRVRSGSTDKLDALALTSLLLQPDVTTVLVGAGEPPGADERGGLGEVAAVAAAAATRRPELTVVLAGAMAEQAPRFSDSPDRPGEVLLAPAATSGTPPGTPLRELLERVRGGRDESRPAFARAVGSLADALDRRIEAIELGLDGAIRVHATPGRNGEPGSVQAATLASAALVPPDPDEATIDRVLGWSTVPLDRHRMRDRLRDLRLRPWGDAAGEGGPLRLSAARAAVARLVAETPELTALPPADLVVVAGGAWAVAPGPAIALAVADVVRRPGAAQLAYDHARLLAPLGVIEREAERRRVLGDIAGDLLVPLGSVVMPQGMRAGRAGGRLVVHGTTGSSELELVPGGLELVDLPPGEGAVAEFEFRDPVRLGTRGRHFAVDVAGGLGGLLVDLRDVPLRLPDRADRRRELLAAWQAALWPGVDA
jgi:hypothetical protein